MRSRTRWRGETLADRMRIALFLEDVGHERFIGAFIERLADEVDARVQLEVRNARGGASQLDQQFMQFLKDNVTLDQRLNLVVVIRDTDCVGVERVKTRYLGLVRDAYYSGDVVIGAPEPHIECWYLSDPSALQRVLRADTQATVPDSKCGRDRFKRKLSEVIEDAHVAPLLGGIEYAEDIVEEMDIYRACSNVPSLDTFVRDLRRALGVYTDAT